MIFRLKLYPALALSCLLQIPLLKGQSIRESSFFEFRQGGSEYTYVQSKEEPTIFYRAGQEQTPANRRTLTNQIVVQYTDLETLEEEFSDLLFQIKNPEETTALVTTASADHTLVLLSGLSENPVVLAIEPIMAFQPAKKATINDPLYPYPNDDTTPYQWYLHNPNGTPGYAGINATSAWSSQPSSGINIAIVDDGLDFSHEDLGNARRSPALNLNQGDPNSAAIQTLADRHGTAVAGIIGASSNEIGIVGVAFDSNLYSVRISADPVSDSEVAQAFEWEKDLIDVYNHGWGPSDETTFLEGPGILTQTSLEASIANGRDGKGAIHVVPAGNGHEIGDQANFDGFANSRYTIAVGAVTYDFHKAPYSEEGANLLLTAPSSGNGFGVLTTSFNFSTGPFGLPLVNSTYQSDYGGTSAAAAMVSGTVALMLKANPDLTWRDGQNILIKSAEQNDSTDPGWLRNIAGNSFNNKYGAGILDARSAVSLARHPAFILGPASQIEGHVEPQVLLADNDGSSTFIEIHPPTHDRLKCEHVELTLDFTTTRRADLELILYSPSGTPSLLTSPYPNSGEGMDGKWTFLSNQFWGEGSDGIWILKATDQVSGEQVRINSASLVLHGSVESGAPLNTKPFFLSPVVLHGEKEVPFSHTLIPSPNTTISFASLPDGVTFDPETYVLSGIISSGDSYVLSANLIKDNALHVNAIFLEISPTAEGLGSRIGQPDLIPTSSIPYSWIGQWQTVVNSPEQPHGTSTFFALHDLPPGVLLFDWALTDETGESQLELHLGEIDSDSPLIRLNSSFSGQSTAIELTEATNNVFWNFTRSNLRAHTSLAKVRHFSTTEYQEQLQIGMDPLITISTSGDGLWRPFRDDFPNWLASSHLGESQESSLHVELEGPGTFEVFIFAPEGSQAKVLLNNEVQTSLEPISPASFVLNSVLIPPGQHQVDITNVIPSEARSSQAAAVIRDPKFTPASQANEFSYQWYADSVLPEGDRSPHQDADGNGETNLFEYAYRHFAPQAGTSNIIQISDGSIRFLTNGFSESVTYTLQETSDLKTWTNIPNVSFSRWFGAMKEFTAPLGNDPKKQFRVKLELEP